MAKSKGKSKAKPSNAPEPALPPSQFTGPPGYLELSSWAVFALVLSVYYRTLYNNISGGDSGELVVTTCNWGVAHPPGYPTFTMIGGVFARLFSTGSWAWRINLCNAIQGSFAAMLVHRTVSKLTGNVWAGTVASCFYAFSPTIWLYHIQGEVFGLNNLIVAAMAYLTVVYFEASGSLRDATSANANLDSKATRMKRQTNGQKKRSPPDESAPDGNESGAKDRSVEDSVNRRRAVIIYALLGAFVCGLATTNQHTTVFYIIPTVLFVVFDLYRLGLLSGGVVVSLTVSVLLGAAPYAYLVVAAHWKSKDSWGDQRSVSGFLHHFLRREYGTFQLAADNTSGDPGMLVRLNIYLKVLLQESHYVAPPIATVGALYLLRPSFRLMHAGWVFLSGYTFYMIMFHYLANLDPLNPLFLGVQARFWQQANLHVYIWMGVGFHAALVLLSGYHTVVRKNISTIASVLAVALAAYQLQSHFHSRDFSGTQCFQAHGEAILRSFPKQSIVLLNGDLNNNIVKYPHECEGMRRDLRVISLQLMTWEWFVDMQAHNYPNVTFPGHRYHPRVQGGFSLKQFLDSNISKFHIFLCGPFKSGDDSYRGFYETLPFGHCERIVAQGWRPKNLARFYRRGLRGLNITSLGEWDPVRYTDDTWERVVFHDTWSRARYLASYISFEANKNLHDKKLLKVARDSMDMVFQDDTLPYLLKHKLLTSAFYRDGGIVFGQYSKVAKDKGKTDECLEYERKMLSLWQKFVAETGDQKEIFPMVRDGVNPYTGGKIPSC